MGVEAEAAAEEPREAFPQRGKNTKYRYRSLRKRELHDPEGIYFPGHLKVPR